MDYETDNELQSDDTPLPAEPAEGQEETQSPSDAALVKKIINTIRADKEHHKDAFKRMERDMAVAYSGRDKTWGPEKYTANICGRHVKNKTAALYAKNPKAVARRRETIDFQVWDESVESLQVAMMAVQQGQMMLASAPPAPPQIDPATGNMVQPQPEMPPGYAEAQAVIQDYSTGMERRKTLAKFGRTLEILFARALQEQQPLDFKQAMKHVVRRASTTSVGYVELGFQREYGPRPATAEKLADFRARIDHLRKLAEEMAEGELEETSAEIAELQHSSESLMSEPEIILREGLIFDFPQSTKVIPDRLCKSLEGFVGARHVTIEYDYTKNEVEELFEVSLGKKYTPYTAGGEKLNQSNGVDFGDDGQGELPLGTDSKARDGEDLVRVWKHYDKVSGLVYYLCDGHDKFIRPPAAPDVFVSDFWPIYALTFNAVEHEKELFPPSDVGLLLDMQMEYNRSRQGKREHRKAARPRWAYANGAFEDEDIDQLKRAEPFEAVGLNIDPQTKLADVLQAIPVPGVDPNLYDVNEIITDMQIVGGFQPAQVGAISKATATESAIAADSSNTSDGSSTDDLDAFLSSIARAGGQILMREMSPEKVMEIVGPGAVWPEQTLSDIAKEVYLEVEAGSAGKPNQAVEIRNWKEMLPFLIQMGGIRPVWLARETLRRLDDKMDLTDAIVEGVPSIVAMNSMKQPAPGDPAQDPTQQGDQGGNNGPQAPGGATGSDAPIGNNQV